MGRLVRAPVGRMPRGTIVFCGVIGSACAAAPRASDAGARPVDAASTTPTAGGEVLDFPEVTSSPDVGPAPPGELAPFFELCRQGDAALSRVAERFARRRSGGGAALDASELGFALRAEGSPYVWPRAWTLEGAALDDAAAAQRMSGWLRGFDDGGERRCGVALVSGAERSVLAAIAVDTLADLSPLPVRVRAGAWLNVEARLLVATTDAKVIVLGPTGSPYAVPTSFDGRNARARFRADRPGPFLVQLLASVAGGPRPVLEATVYVDVPPPSSFFSARAPGEPSAPLPSSLERGAALLQMLNEARATEQSPPLCRDPALDAIARAHAEAMRAAKRVAHDTGDGDPRTRVQAAGLDVTAAGENVAHAEDVSRAHRILWASPSHRQNLLNPRFGAVGIGVAPDADGTIWVCEVFADGAPCPR